MNDTASVRFIAAAIAEGGQPVSAGGPPLRNLAHVISAVQSANADRLFLAAAQAEGGQPVSAGGPPIVTVPQTAG